MRDLGVDSLRPWDMGVDVKGRPPLQPFNDVQEMVDGCSRIFHNMSEELGITSTNSMPMIASDLDSRKEKHLEDISIICKRVDYHLFS